MGEALNAASAMLAERHGQEGPGGDGPNAGWNDSVSRSLSPSPAVPSSARASKSASEDLGGGNVLGGLLVGREAGPP
jgi:hypothetical protein